MRKISIFLILLFVIWGGNCWAQQNNTANKNWKKVHEFNVGPFELNKAVLTNKLKEQIVDNLGQIPENATLLVDGYTDSSGPLAYNQKLAKLRAQEVAREIDAAKPSAKFNCRGNPHESSEDVNYRMARVRVYIQKKSPSSATAEEQEGKVDGTNRDNGTEVVQAIKDLGQNLKKDLEEGLSKLGKTEKLREDLEKYFFILIFLFIVLMVLGIVIVLWAIRKNSSEIKEYLKRDPEENQGQEKSEEQSKEEWVDIEAGSKRYQVRIEWREREGEGAWYSPFISLQGRPIYRKNRDDLVKKSLKDGLKKGKFSDQIEKLKEQGKIKEVSHG